MIKRSLRIFMAWIIAICVFISLPVSAQAEASGTTSRDLEYLRAVMEMIKEKYGGDVSEEQLIEGALKGMFGIVDPYTAYFNKKEADDYLSAINGTFEGIGVTMEAKDTYIEVAKVFKSSPAEKAGIAAGDRIVSIDGKDVAGLTIEEAGNLIKGHSGTAVVLDIARGDKVEKIKVVRGVVTINPVSYRIDGDIGYIRLEIFNEHAGWFFIRALNEMDKNDISKIILDLRGNPGGDVAQAVTIARQLVPQGLITRLDFKSELISDQEYYSYLKESKYKLAVLVNESSASASEILAGAIQDTGAGTIIGKKTFGKAKVQNIIPILTPEAYEKYKEMLGVDVVDAFELVYAHGIEPLESEISGYTKMTTGMYTTPKGRMIDLIGIEPDIEADNPSLVNGIDISMIEKLEKVDKPGLNSVGSQIYNAEKILKAIGYDIDAADSKLDKKTFDAIKKFQKDKGGFSYGVLDFTTQQWLNEELDKLFLKADAQYAKAVEELNK